MHTLNLEDAARALNVSSRSLADKRYRARIGLAVRKVGRRVVFAEADILKLLERSREPLPGERR